MLTRCSYDGDDADAPPVAAVEQPAVSEPPEPPAAIEDDPGGGRPEAEMVESHDMSLNGHESLRPDDDHPGPPSQEPQGPDASVGRGDAFMHHESSGIGIKEDG